MKIREIVNTTEHRPWKIPKGNWKFYQEWNKAIFLHWQVSLSDLKPFIPDELKIDLFEGKPWISLVAFTMENIRPRYLPPFSLLSNFDEINIRTYVTCNQKAGVYFLSIEGGKRLSCKVARAISELPYRYSDMERSAQTYQSSNPEFADRLKMVYQVGKAKSRKDQLDTWLTERYALFQDTEQAINEFEIHHAAWPLNEIEIDMLELDYPRFKKLLKNKPDKALYSKGVQVLAWGKERLE